VPLHGYSERIGMYDFISVIKFLRNALDNFIYYVPVIQCIINKGLVQSLKQITPFLSELFVVI
jgi:hypothetical protein